MKFAQIASVGLVANTLIDRHLEPPFTFEDIYDALEEYRFLELLLPHDAEGHLAWAKDAESRLPVEKVFRQAAEELEGHEMARVGVGGNPLCLIVALAFQVVQGLQVLPHERSPRQQDPGRPPASGIRRPTLLSALGLA